MKNIITRLFGQRKFRQFVVICHPRTGSNLLLSYLGTHPNIKAQREIFKRLDGRTINDIYQTFMRKMPWNIKAKGFKIFYTHPEDGDHEQLLDLIDSMPDPLIIHLTREDKLHTLVSWRISLKTDVWGVKEVQDFIPADQKSVNVNPAEALNFLKSISEHEHRIHQRFGHKHYLSLTYEQLIRNPSDCLQKICMALNLKYMPMQTNYKKFNTEPLQKLVRNYDELKDKGILEQFKTSSSHEI